MRTVAACFALVLGLHGHTVAAASPFDGVYRGTYYPTGGGNARCPEGKAMSITVTDGKFTYGAPGEAERVPVSIATDGSFSVQSSQRHLQGKIQGGQMSATTSGGRCTYIWALNK